MSLLANELDVLSIFHGQVSLTAVNQNVCLSLGYERLQKSKDSLKARDFFLVSSGAEIFSMGFR